MGRPTPFASVSRPSPAPTASSSSRWATRRCSHRRLFERVVAEQTAGGTPLALVSARMDDPAGYGRIVRGPDGGVAAIVEEADADEATLALHEVNAGTYAFELPGCARRSVA